MTHGELLALDTPKNIKSKFGVGYNIFLEPRNAAISDQEKEQIFEKLRKILLDR